MTIRLTRRSTKASANRIAQMETLHQEMMTTKAHEYLLAVVFMTAFILFWCFATRKRKDNA